tara:strand:- start:12246 stop:12644 length:399 start_codon:yes stop_codon:yes gene_type:complete
VVNKEPSNEKQEYFLNLVVEGMDVAEAAEEAEYSRVYAYELAKIYREYILERVEGYLCLHAPKAAKRIVEGLDEDGRTPGRKLRMDAAQTVLDRGIGLVKKEQISVDINAGHGIFILPAKETSEAVRNDTDD